MSDFQLRVNEAAIELALVQPSLIRKRGELLENARKKAADDGYCFKKGKSRSKIIGNSDDAPTTSKRPKLDQTMRQDRIKDLEENIADISSHIVFNTLPISVICLCKNTYMFVLFTAMITTGNHVQNV